MPPKKKKNAGKSKPRAGAPRSDQGKEKKSDQTSVQTTADGDPSPATQTLDTAPITTDSEIRNAQTQSLLFKLPTEIRVMIYGYVLNNETLEIGTRRELRSQFRKQRLNQFTLENFNSKHFALIKTCTEIKKDIEGFVLPKLAFSFASMDAFARFLGSHNWFLEHGELDDNNFNLLKKVSRVEVVIPRHLRWHHPLHAMGWIERALKRPLDVEFVDWDRDEDYTSRACREATRRWGERLQEIKALQADG